MRAYCNADTVVATHADDVLIDPSLYGETIDVIIVPDDFTFERLGDWAPDVERGENGSDDPRPFARPLLDLIVVKAQVKRAVDDAAEIERLKYITGGAGQAMTYARKTDEARRVEAAIAAEEDVQPADYPLLAASLGIDGNTIAEVAAVILAMDTAWAQIGAAIEAARLGAKQAIDAADDEATARAVAPAWPQP